MHIPSCIAKVSFKDLVSLSSPEIFIVGRLLLFYYLNDISYCGHICLDPLDLILVGHTCLVIYFYSAFLSFGGDSFSIHALIRCILLVSVVMPSLHNFIMPTFHNFINFSFFLFFFSSFVFWFITLYLFKYSSLCLVVPMHYYFNFHSLFSALIFIISCILLWGLFLFLYDLEVHCWAI